MIPHSLEGNALWESLYAAGIIAASFFISRLFIRIIPMLVKAFTSRTKTTLDDLLVEVLKGPASFLIITIGSYIAFSALTFLDDGQKYVNKTAIIATIAVIGYGIKNAVMAVFTWYAKEIASKTVSDMDDKLLPILRRVSVAIIFSITALTALSEVGISISPILASLGIGGLAVALALQPTITNFVASAYIISEGRIAVNNRIENDGGPAGMVEDIGWRTTKIRTDQNNLVMVPNSKLADSIVTNFEAPTREVVIALTSGVSYESDLEKVRTTILEIASGVIAESPDSVKEFQPIVRFTNFGESNIDFVVVVKAQSYGAQYVLKDLLIRRIHARFTKEGIEINYPVRKLLISGNSQLLDGQGSQPSTSKN